MDQIANDMIDKIKRVGYNIKFSALNGFISVPNQHVCILQLIVYKITDLNYLINKLRIIFDCNDDEINLTNSMLNDKNILYNISDGAPFNIRVTYNNGGYIIRYTNLFGGTELKKLIIYYLQYSDTQMDSRWLFAVQRVLAKHIPNEDLIFICLDYLV